MIGTRKPVPSGVYAQAGAVIQRAGSLRTKTPTRGVVASRPRTPVLTGRLWRYRNATPSRVGPRP